MLAFWVAWAWVKSFWELTLIPIIAKIPWYVWVALVIVIAFLWYGHVREQRALKECYAQVEQAKNLEIQRQQEVADKVVQDAKKREEEAQNQSAKLQEDLNNALHDVAKLKEANKVCLPRSITDQLRGVRKPVRR